MKLTQHMLRIVVALVALIIMGLSSSPIAAQSGADFIVFTSDRTGKVTSHIYKMNADGSNVKPITTGNSFDTAPDIYVPSNLLVYQSNRATRQIDVYDLFVIDLNTKALKPVQLTRNKGSNVDPSWSPDGSRIAFLSTRTGNLEIFVMDANGKNVQQLTDSADLWISSLSWSPDGDKIYFGAQNIDNVVTNPRNLYTVSVKDKTVVKLTDETRESSGYTAPDVSPKGDMIAVTEFNAGKTSISLLDLSGKPIQHLSVEGYGPVWTGNGDLLFLRSNLEKGPSRFNRQIFFMKADGSGVQPIAVDKYSNNYPTWGTTPPK